MINNRKITVFGAGAFGTCIANMLALAGHDIKLWAREPKVVDSIKNNRENTTFLPDAGLENFFVTSDAGEAADGSEIAVFAIPCQHIRSFLKQSADILPTDCIIANLAKGIEVETAKTTSQIFSDLLGDEILQRYATISGPSFAREIYQKMPTAACVASQNEDIAVRVRETLSQKWFRLYSSTDFKGVELGGALKNIIAIGVGISDGLGFGQNSRAGLITRSLHEMIKLGVEMGAQPQTFSGLSGIGDLILTCMGDLSRNRQTGLRLGRGEKIEEILKSTPHVSEGVPTSKAVHEIAIQRHLDLPNMEHIYKILYEGLAPKDAFEMLMSRELKKEF
ncbi:MAG: NAD(P)-dependent glycerol-3-phosphate dehydrogenase [Deltaproteobacteria bacterium]|jgi:glycerol-3-phosphate dehydrogenase (NAD(P)+)|nr:NAD(P)-dependent glycerol-3-phosphate dehydrogenase [Deltaproteobacteria bacterium]